MTSALFCTKCGQMNDASATFCARCGAPQSGVAGTMPPPPQSWSQQPQPAAGTMAQPAMAPPAPVVPAAPTQVGYTGYGGFWIRVVAFIIDAIIVSAAMAPVRMALGLGAFGMGGGFRHGEPQIAAMVGAAGMIFLISTCANWLYFALMESSSKQATLGKMVCGLVVADVNAARISFARASGRYFSKWLSAMILMIGFIMAGFTQRKQALHDMIAGTYVLKTR